MNSFLSFVLALVVGISLLSGCFSSHIINSEGIRVKTFNHSAYLHPILSNIMITAQLNNDFCSISGVFNGRAVNSVHSSAADIIHLAKIPSPLMNVAFKSDQVTLHTTDLAITFDFDYRTIMRVSASNDSNTKVFETWILGESGNSISYVCEITNAFPVSEDITVEVYNPNIPLLNQSFEDLEFIKASIMPSFHSQYYYRTRESEFPNEAYGSSEMDISLTISPHFPLKITIPANDTRFFTAVAKQSYSSQSSSRRREDVPPVARRPNPRTQSQSWLSPNDLLNSVRFLEADNNPSSSDESARPLSATAELALTTTASLFYLFSPYNPSAYSMPVSSYGNVSPLNFSTSSFNINSTSPPTTPDKHSSVDVRNSGVISPEMELYMLPLVQIFCPQFASDLMQYRTLHSYGASINSRLEGGTEGYRFPYASAQTGVDVFADFGPPNSTNPFRPLSADSHLALYSAILPLKSILDWLDLTGNFEDSSYYITPFNTAVDIVSFLMDRITIYSGWCSHTVFPSDYFGDSGYPDRQDAPPPLCLSFNNVSSFDAHTTRYNSSTGEFRGVDDSAFTNALFASVLLRLADAFTTYTPFDKENAQLAQQYRWYARNMRLPVDAQGIRMEYSDYNGDNITQADAISLQYPLRIPFSTNKSRDHERREKELQYYLERTDPAGLFQPSVAHYIISLLSLNHTREAGALFKQMMMLCDNPFKLWLDGKPRHSTLSVDVSTLPDPSVTFASFRPRPNFIPATAAFLQVMLFGYGCVSAASGFASLLFPLFFCLFFFFGV
eukprot:GCRY01002686.1.p1 GENE.GCRY01002686.1~~GCRY01002686.1.p1  ORF type:complete len:785 (-),score=144.25 GCRY01002686.1:509-2863(-)